jgi:hypothetical protein
MVMLHQLIVGLTDSSILLPAGGVQAGLRRHHDPAHVRSPAARDAAGAGAVPAGPLPGTRETLMMREKG